MDEMEGDMTTDAPITDDDIVRAMEIFGGSFVVTLGKLWHRADAVNRARIKATWPDVWEHYAEVAEMKRQKEPVS